ncbi:GTPase family protein [Chitinilyticum piscinae]|uniref:50S ribosome-binding GTPase n=1 Tax=Chitinilyticum piscinae TaxID=2866724 RepID=A0A8J7KC14_9NEIS|nr:GTPase [Chitinilyticum piscinae]MBE9610819.1 50S ribosome-binding GTPase [Chitinilyticum piscinae]
MKNETQTIAQAQNDIFSILEHDILSSNAPESEKVKMLRNLQHLKAQKLNLLITGATGVGKSSTINALFDTEVARVGTSPEPETMDIAKYELGNLVIWDSPGLGDGKEADNRHAKGIISKLNELDQNGQPLIDVVLVLLDAGSRDMGTAFQLINEIVIPNLGNQTDRLIVALNQADMAMRGRHWDFEANRPQPPLSTFLDEKVTSVARRIKESTGVSVEPMYFSAGYKEGYECQHPYNLAKLLYFIVRNAPAEKRIVLVDTTNKQQEMWEDNDELEDYIEETRKTMWQSVTECASKGVDIGGNIGGFFGETGRTIGKAIGGAVGAVVGFFSSFW